MKYSETDTVFTMIPETVADRAYLDELFPHTKGSYSVSMAILHCFLCGEAHIPATGKHRCDPLRLQHHQRRCWRALAENGTPSHG